MAREDVATRSQEVIDRGEDAGRPSRILVVEDDAQIAFLGEEVLAMAGYLATSVSTGQEALIAAAEADLVLIDLGLPDLDGMEVCRMLRATPELSRLPIVLLTARDNPRDRVRGIESGADDYVTKPFDPEELVARIRSLLRTRRIEAALRERTRALDTLRRLTSTVVNAIALEELAQQIVDAVPDAFGRDSSFIGGVISTVDQQSRMIQARAITSDPLGVQIMTTLGQPLTELDTLFDPPQTLQHEVAASGEPRDGDHLVQFITPPVPDAASWSLEHLVGMRGGVAEPVKVQGKTIGVFLFVTSKPVSAVTMAERALMADFATTTGIALENVRLYTMAERLMLTDGLTGIANRRHFDQTLAQEIPRSGRHGYPLGLLMIDIDHFKRYNDTRGHPAGDEALRTVADLLRRSVRTTDLVARYGGEEFAVLLPGTSAHGAWTVGEKARRAVLEAGALGLTISVGGTVRPTSDGADLIAAADAALYEAKRNGRNQTVIK